MKKIISALLILGITTSNGFTCDSDYSMNFNDDRQGYVVSYKDHVMPLYTMDCHGQYPKDIKTAEKIFKERKELLDRSYKEDMETIENTTEVPALLVPLLIVAMPIAMTVQMLGSLAMMPFALFESESTRVENRKYYEQGVQLSEEVNKLISDNCN